MTTTPEIVQLLAEHVRLTTLDFPFTCSCEPYTQDSTQSHREHVAALVTAFLAARGGNTDNGVRAAVEGGCRAVEDWTQHGGDQGALIIRLHGSLLRARAALDAAPAPTDNQRDNGLAERVLALADGWQRQVTTLRADRSAGDLLAGDLANQLAHHVAALRAVVDGPTSKGGDRG